MEPGWALIDTGAEHVFAASWIADFANVDLSRSAETVLIGIGGQVVEVSVSRHGIPCSLSFPVT